MTSNSGQHITQKINGSVALSQIRNEGELRCSGRVNISCFTSGTRRVNARENQREKLIHDYMYIMFSKVLYWKERMNIILGLLSFYL
jgi:hypothetical protein